MSTPLAARAQQALGKGVGGLLRLNWRSVERAAARPDADEPADGVFATDDLAWAGRLEDRWPALRAEVDAMLAEGTRFPRIEDVLDQHQGNERAWRAFVLVGHGKVVEANARRCPATVAAVLEVPGLQSALLSAFDPHTHLPAHRGPNKGVLRYHLPLRVPGPPGAARLRVGDRTLPYTERTSILFDDTHEHEAWNDSDGVRTTLMLEVVRDLPGAAGALNRLTQAVYGTLPQVRGAHARIDELDRALNPEAGRVS